MKAIRRIVLPYLTIIQNRRYFPLWLGQLVSSLGDTLNYIAIVIYVFQLTGSGFDLAKLSIFQIVPILLIAPVAGVVIDRFSRKKVLIAADIARAVADPRGFLARAERGKHLYYRRAGGSSHDVLSAHGAGSDSGAGCGR